MTVDRDNDADALIHGRRHFSPGRLGEPGPDDAQLERIFAAAAAAPDHGQLLPWRFVLIPRAARGALGEVFAQALRERDPSAGPDDLAAARAKADRGACVVLAIADLGPREGRAVRDVERLVSLGAAIQNMLLASRAQGFGSGLVSGKAFESKAMRRAFALAPHEEPVCFVVIGTPVRPPSTRERPATARFVGRWPD